MPKARRISIVHNTNLEGFRDNTIYESCQFYLVRATGQYSGNGIRIMLCTHDEKDGPIAFSFFDPKDNSISQTFNTEYVRSNYQVLAKITAYVSISANLSDLSDLIINPCS